MENKFHYFVIEFSQYNIMYYLLYSRQYVYTLIVCKCYKLHNK